MDNQFYRELDEWLIAIDERCINIGFPIIARPLYAATKFVELAVIEVEGHSKDDYLGSDWFGLILKDVHKWYRKKYGDALKPRSRSLMGAVEVYGGYFLVEIPTSLILPNDQDTYWVVFPNEIDAKEDPLAWVADPPVFDAMAHELLEAFRETVSSRCTLLRKTASLVLHSKRESDAEKEIANAIVTHMNTAAEWVVRGKEVPQGLTCWEAHQAVEKSLKLLLQQQQRSYPKWHNLLNLADLARVDLEAEDRTALETMPSGERLFELRMGEGATVSRAESYEVYCSALLIVSAIARAMPRTLALENARFLLKKMPWQKGESGG